MGLSDWSTDVCSADRTRKDSRRAVSAGRASENRADTTCDSYARQQKTWPLAVRVDKEIEADHHRCGFPSEQAAQAAEMDDIDKFVEDELQEKEARIATERKSGV